MDDYFILTPPVRPTPAADATFIDVLHTLGIGATARLLAGLNKDSAARRPVLIEDFSALPDGSRHTPWSPTRLMEALQLLRMRPILETFRSRDGANWFRIHASTNPTTTDVDLIGDTLADARRDQLKDLTTEAGILCDLGEYSAKRANTSIPAEQAAINGQLKAWRDRPRNLPRKELRLVHAAATA